MTEPTKVEKVPVKNGYFLEDGKLNIYTKGALYKTFGVISNPVAEELGIPSVSSANYSLGEENRGFLDTYSYYGVAFGGSLCPNSPTGCKDYVNDWIYNKSAIGEFDEQFKDGLYFTLMYSTKNTVFPRLARNIVNIIKQFMIEIKYENPEHVKIFAIGNRTLFLYMHRNVLTIPPMISAILALSRNAYMYNKAGENVSDYLKYYGDSYRAGSESSSYRYIREFVDAFAGGKYKLSEVFCMNHTKMWNSYISNQYGKHGGFGVRTCMAYNLLDRYKAWTEEDKKERAAKEEALKASLEALPMVEA